MELFPSCNRSVDSGGQIEPVGLTSTEQQELNELKQFLRPRLEKQVAYSGQPFNVSLFEQAVPLIHHHGWNKARLEKLEGLMQQALAASPSLTSWVWFNFDNQNKSIVAFVTYESYPRVDYLGNFSINMAATIDAETEKYLPFIVQHEALHVKDRLYWQKLYPEVISQQNGQFVFDHKLYQLKIRDFFSSKTGQIYPPNRADTLTGLYNYFIEEDYYVIESSLQEVRAWAQTPASFSRELFLHLFKSFVRANSSSDSLTPDNLQKVFSDKTANAAFFALLADKYGYVDIANSLRQIFAEDSFWSFISDKYSPPKYFQMHYDLFAAQWDISQKFINF